MTDQKTADTWDAALAAHRQNDFARAAELYRQRLAEAPDDARPAGNLIAALHQAGDSKAALEFARDAARRFPKSSDILINTGTVLAALREDARAVKIFERAVALDPSLAHSCLSLAYARVKTGDLPGAVAAFEQASKNDPSNIGARVQIVHQSQQMLGWDRIDAHLRIIQQAIAADNGGIDPWSLMSVCHEPAEHLRCARAFSNRIARDAGPAPFAAKKAKSAKGRPLRVGYLSADFREHPTSHLAIQLFESHDRKKVETFAYAVDNPYASRMRDRMRDAFSHFRELGGKDAASAAQIIADDDLDILIDTMGYTQSARPDVLSMRPAPVQIGFLGFPGSTGAPFIDYIIADRHVFPPGDEAMFSEAPIRMPLSYQVNNSARPPIERPKGQERAKARKAAGLPEEGVVFGSFNQLFKLTPDVLAMWVRILRGVEGSVLWVVGYNEAGMTNLRRMLGASGLSPDRLVVAPIAAQEDHLPRCGLVDIMLDTHPCGGHTTTSDAVRAGCPVITLTGKTFASRVGASLLDTLGFPELIAADRETYVALAVDLGNSKQKLTKLQNKIWKTAQEHPMFDGEKFARDLEKALKIVHERAVKGEPPAAVDL